ncbi:BrnT family toxin [Polynucleobacter sp. P1-05-14]|uniref:BrnT family toxin n=1 Tax=Polynucleobacter sp. P1-05-14 TaxID=1819732 RepID=UPI00351CF6B9
MYNVHMTSLRFEWEPRKASANLKKHGISFEEAKSVFYDESAKLIFRPRSFGGRRQIYLAGSKPFSSCDFGLPLLSKRG